MGKRFRLEDIFRGRLDFEVTGERLYSFINAVRETGMVIRQQHCQEQCFCGAIRRKDRKRFCRLAEQFAMGVTFQESPSLPAVLYRYRYRFGIPVGLLLGAVMLIYTANVVMVIDIQGNQQVQDSEILSVLETCGIERGVFIGSVDFYRSELALHAAYPEIAWAGIRHTGNRLVVEVLETVQKPDMADTRIPSHVVATHTAQITDASVLCGTMQKQIGDAVQAGEVIISGIQTDDYEHMTFRHAMGSITGIYEEEQTFISTAEQSLRSLTGNETEKKLLDIFSVKLPLSDEGNPYADYNRLTQRIPMTLFGKELPIAIERDIYAEYAWTVIQRTEADRKADLEQQRKRYEENFLRDVTILEARPHYIKKETAMVLTVSYVLEGEIGAEKELMLKSDRMPYVSGSHKD